MAFYSLYNWFSTFRKTPYINMIHWYKKQLCEQWFNSLSDEEQERVLKITEEKKRKRQLAARQLLIGLSAMYGTIECNYPKNDKVEDIIQYYEDY